MEQALQTDACRVEVETLNNYRKEIPNIVNQLVLTCGQEDCFEHVSPEPLPSRKATIDILDRAMRILFPGYSARSRVDQVNLSYYFGQEATAFFDMLSKQITLAVRHECLLYNQPCTHCEQRGHQAAVVFMRELPRLRSVLGRDVRAAYAGDPAAKNYDEIIFSYPGLFAVTVYRIAHQLWEQGIPLLPRIMSEYAHGSTGIDIHPGAHIGESFFIDHGTGVVVGETTEIGDRVRLYQGVTLGASQFPGMPPRGSGAGRGTPPLRTT